MEIIKGISIGIENIPDHQLANLYAEVSTEIDLRVMKIADSLGLDYQGGYEVFHIRLQPWWTQEREEKYIRMYEAGNPPDQNNLPEGLGI